MRPTRRLQLASLVLALMLSVVPPGTATTPEARAQGVPAVIVTTLADDGALSPGACFSARAIGPNSRFGSSPTCDDEDGAADGVTTITNVFGEGTYALHQVTAAKGYQVGGRSTFDSALVVTAQVTVQQVAGGEEVRVTATTEDGAPIVSSGVDDTGNPTPPICFLINRDNGIGRSGEPVARGCIPEGATNGVATLGGVPPGDYLLQSGFTSEFDRISFFDTRISVRTDEATEVETVFAPAARGTMTVRTVDDAGTPVIDLCVRLERTDAGPGENSYYRACDNFDGTTGNARDSDGVVEVTQLPDGRYALQPDEFPVGFRISKNKLRVSVADGAAEEQTLTLDRGGQSLTILAVPDTSGTSFGGCFQVREDLETYDIDSFFSFVCANTRPDGTLGVQLSVPSGDLVVAHANLPEARAPQPDRRVTVGSGEEASISMDTASEAVIDVELVDDKGNASTGCVSLVAEIDGFLDGRATYFPSYQAICDGDDGLVDGLVSVHNLPAGEFTLVHVTAARGRQLAENVEVTVAAGETKTAQLVSPKGGGRALVTIADEREDALFRPSCLGFYEDDGGELGALVTIRCADYDGVFDQRTTATGLPPGDYLIVIDASGVIVDPPRVAPLPLTIVDGETAKATLTIESDADSS